jgi:hypothetical protein
LAVTARAELSFRWFVLDLAGVSDAARCVKDLEGQQIAMLVVVENHAGHSLGLLRFARNDRREPTEIIRLRKIGAVPQKNASCAIQ